MTPTTHATLLSVAAILSLVFAGIMASRNPGNLASRMHAIYGCLITWWFICMAMVASSDNTESLFYWSRLVHVSVGMIPAVIYHNAVAMAKTEHFYRSRVLAHYAVATLITLFCLSWPNLFGLPQSKAWGLYPTYTTWGLIPMFALAVVLVESANLYRKTAQNCDNPVQRKKLTAFYVGSLLAMLVLVDFLCIFGFDVYPFGFVVITCLNAGTLWGLMRYQIIEIMPEFAEAQILNTLPDGILVLDSTGIIRFANDAATRMLDCQSEPITGRSFINVAPDSLLPLIELPVVGPRNSEIQLNASDGPSPLTLRVSCSSLQDRSGYQIGDLWTLHDFTAQRQAEDERDELEHRTRHSQKLETLGVMAGGIAHDFNNLLGIILGNAELANIKLEDDVRVAKEIQTIVSATERAAELTNQMLTFAGQGSTARVPVDLNSLCKEIGELLKSAISKKAELKLEFAEKLPSVVADRGQLIQVIMNLVTNASDALAQAPGTIIISTAVDGMKPGTAAGSTKLFVSLRVTDTGMGMNRDTRDRMFDPFYTTKFTGRGLGLANVLGIVQSHGGSIDVSSKPGKGTAITITLPSGNDPVAEDRVAAKTSGWQGKGIAMLVDDEPEIRRVAARMLRRAGFTVLEASHGKEAVELFRQRKSEISVILLDITMPVMDGREALREIRALSAEVPVVLMSGYSIEPVDLSGSEHTWFLNKPFKYSALERCLHSAVQED